MRIACLRPKATNTHSVYVLLIALALQQWLQERFSVLRYSNLAFLVLVIGNYLVYVDISLEVRLIYKDHVLMTFYKISLG
jgi:hypothetical protein